LPLHRSAAKAWRQSEKRRLRNKALKTRIKTATKKFLKVLEEGDLAKAEEAFREAQSLIQRAASKGTLHWRTAARKISRLAAKLNARKATLSAQA